MSELRKLKRGISTKRGDHLVQNGHHPFHEGEEQQQQQYWPSPRAPPVSPSESPRTPGGSQKKPVLGRVKSKAKKWMHLLHPKKKPAHEELMWTPRAGPSAGDVVAKGSREQQTLDAYLGTPSKAQHPNGSCMSVTNPARSFDFERGAPEEVFMDATPRQNSPVPSPTAQSLKEQPYFKVSSRFESEMKEANEMLRESKQLRVRTTRQKTVTFAPSVEHDQAEDCTSGRELSGAASQVFRNAYEALCQAVLRMICKIQEMFVAYSFDRRRVLETAMSVHRYLPLKLEPGEDDRVLSEVVTEAVLDLYHAWWEHVEEPLVQRVKEVSSWFLNDGREETPHVPVSADPCVYEDAEEFYSLDD